MKFLAFEVGLLLPVDCSETWRCLVPKLCILIRLLAKQKLKASVKLSLKRQWSFNNVLNEASMKASMTLPMTLQ